MKLTLRQRNFLSQVLELYQELRRPFHYSEVAQRLGLSSFTAYDMLRVLEEKGLIRSQYILKKDSGPGRSSIRFSPTAKAMEFFQGLAGDIAEQEEWNEMKFRILAALRQERASDSFDKLLSDLLSQTSKVCSPLVFCAQIIVALLLALRRIKHKFRSHNPVALLLKMPPSRLGLGMLAGLALGLILADQLYRQVFSNFQGLMERYEISLQQLSPEKLEQLQDFTREVAMVLKIN